MKRKTKIVFAVSSCLLLTAVFFGYHEYYKGNDDLAGAKAEICIAAPVLLEEFTKNEPQANAKYLNKIICIRGVITSAVKDHTGSVSLNLDTGNPLAGISCEIDSRHIEAAQKLHIGDTVNITGICTGMLTDVVLVRCSVEQK